MVELLNGECVDAEAQMRPGDILLFPGRQLEVSSGGFYRALRHRTIAPASGAARISAPFFLRARPGIALAPGLHVEDFIQEDLERRRHDIFPYHQAEMARGKPWEGLGWV